MKEQIEFVTAHPEEHNQEAELRLDRLHTLLDQKDVNSRTALDKQRLARKVDAWVATGTAIGTAAILAWVANKAMQDPSWDSGIETRNISHVEESMIVSRPTIPSHSGKLPSIQPDSILKPEIHDNKTVSPEENLTEEELTIEERRDQLWERMNMEMEKYKFEIPQPLKELMEELRIERLQDLFQLPELSRFVKKETEKDSWSYIDAMGRTVRLKKYFNNNGELDTTSLYVLDAEGNKVASLNMTTQYGNLEINVDGELSDSLNTSEFSMREHGYTRLKQETRAVDNAGVEKRQYAEYDSYLYENPRGLEIIGYESIKDANYGIPPITGEMSWREAHTLQGNPEKGYEGDIRYLGGLSDEMGAKVKDVIVTFPGVRIRPISLDDESESYEMEVNGKRTIITYDPESAQHGTESYEYREASEDGVMEGFPPPFILNAVLQNKFDHQ